MFFLHTNLLKNVVLDKLNFLLVVYACCKVGVCEMGVGETGVGEMGVGETGIPRCKGQHLFYI